MNEYMIMQLTNKSILDVVKVMLKHDVPQLVILAVIEQIEANDAEAAREAEEAQKIRADIERFAFRKIDI